MSSNYNGNAENIAGNLLPSVTINSSTNTNPVVVQTTAAHGMSTNDLVDITGHSSNYVINGVHQVTVVDATHFSVPVAGVGVGSASGSAQPLALGPTAPEPSDGDDLDAASVDVMLQRLADQTAFLGGATGSLKPIFFDNALNRGVDGTGSVYATITLSGTYQAFSPTSTRYIDVPVQAGDVIEYEFQTTVELQAQNFVCGLAIFYEEYLPGTSFSFGSAGHSNIANQNFGGTTAAVAIAPLTLRGSAVVSQTGLAGMQVAAVEIGTSGHIVQLADSYAWTVKIHRPTGAKV